MKRFKLRHPVSGRIAALALTGLAVTLLALATPSSGANLAAASLAAPVPSSLSGGAADHSLSTTRGAQAGPAIACPILPANSKGLHPCTLCRRFPEMAGARTPIPVDPGYRPPAVPPSVMPCPLPICQGCPVTVCPRPYSPTLSPGKTAVPTLPACHCLNGIYSGTGLGAGTGRAPSIPNVVCSSPPPCLESHPACYPPVFPPPTLPGPGAGTSPTPAPEPSATICALPPLPAGVVAGEAIGGTGSVTGSGSGTVSTGTMQPICVCGPIAIPGAPSVLPGGNTTTLPICPCTPVTALPSPDSTATAAPLPRSCPLIGSGT